MGKKSGLIAVGLVLLATTGCVEAGYPAPSSGYGYAPAYYAPPVSVGIGGNFRIR